MGWAPVGPVNTNREVVYLLSIPGYFKVGRSSNVEGRLVQLRSGCPEKITLRGHSMQVEDGGISAHKMEYEIHKLLAEYRTNGEWFRAPHEVVITAWKYAWVKLARPHVYARYLRRYGDHVAKLIVKLRSSSFAITEAPSGKTKANSQATAIHRKEKGGSRTPEKKGRVGGDVLPNVRAGVGDRTDTRAVRKRGRPRIEDTHKTLKALKPWATAVPPMSRSSWYRRQAEKKS